MAVLLTYDISAQHVAFKKALLAMGYTDQVVGTEDVTNLPNTTLSYSGTTKSASQALNDAQNTAQSLGVILERCFANEYTPTGWNGIKGYPHQ